MALGSSLPHLSNGLPVSIQALLVIAAGAIAYYIHRTLASARPLKGFPLASLPEYGLSPQDSWFKKGRETVEKALDAHHGPFQVLTGTGPKICLPNDFADELKDHPDLDFSKSTEKEFFGTYPGLHTFRPQHGPDFIPEVVRVKLTQSLGLINHDLVDETTCAIHDIFGENHEWHEELLKLHVQTLVARLSSRVFLGVDLCRNERWLKIAKAYTVNAFLAARKLRTVSPLLRPVLHWFLPQCKQVRQDFADAEELITPEIEARKERARKALAAGKKPPKTADAIGWMYETARERREDINYIEGQLGLTLAAIHTTSEAMTTTLLDIMDHPNILADLRKEVIKVIGELGWSKQALYKLRLMDSVLRESARIHEGNYMSMRRIALRSFTLSDGSVIPAGAQVAVVKRTRDPNVFKNPNTFDPCRFLSEREASEKPGQPTASQHVSVTASHMGWGYGVHSCPGRFFASNELKIALAHLLLKYDWQKVKGGGSAYLYSEAEERVSPTCKVAVKRRQEEISVDLDKVHL